METMMQTRWIMLAGAAALLAAAPAMADVRAGVDAWSRGDYAAAVAEWEGPAAAGDADAMFNLAQAYRLGRGVAQDGARAEQLYYRAAQGGHLQAADTYGLMLFQAGRHTEALPYVEDAARRGDPRSQYLLGIAHFNGDNVPRDWVRAYALLTLANGAGLPQAAPAIAEMDQHISMADRQRAAGLAVELRAAADAARAAELAAADLGTGATVEPARPIASPRVPQPVPTVAVSPSVAAARDAVAQARAATGTGSPAEAGADYARPAAAAPRVAGAAPVAAPAPAPAPAAPPARVAGATPQPAAPPACRASARCSSASARCNRQLEGATGRLFGPGQCRPAMGQRCGPAGSGGTSAAQRPKWPGQPAAGRWLCQPGRCPGRVQRAATRGPRLPCDAQLMG